MNGMTERLLRFPQRFSMGGLFTAPLSQPETWDLFSTPLGLIVNPDNQPINWQWLDEARGDVIVPNPESCKIQLKVSASAANLLSPLENLPSQSLHVLDMSRSQINDLSLTHFSHLSSLRVLELAYTPISDAGLAFVARLENLESLGLTATSVTSDGLIHLTGLNHIKELWLNGTQVDDSAVEHISQLSELRLLGLSGTAFTDAGLAGLVGLKDLVRLYLFNTSVSEEGIAKLRAQLPQLRVKWKRAAPTRPEFTLADLVDLSIKAAPTEDSNLSSGSSSSSAVGSASSANAKQIGKPTQKPMQKSIAKPEAVLNQDDFWDIIDLLNWDEEGNDDAVIAPAVQQLSQLSKEEILAFQEILSEKLYMIDGEKYAREIGRDCFKGNIKQFSKDWFLAVRCCAVANGQLFYNDVLLDASSMPKDLGFAALATVAPSAYCRKTGDNFNYKTKYSIDSCSNQKGWPSLHG
jgi:hypothetical protein